MLAEPAPVVVLGIDETRRGRANWVQDEVTGKWRLTERFETNFVDLHGPQGLLGQASGRTRASVTAWLDARGQEWKDAVQIVAMDPCASYRAAVREALPHARIVADHFHLVALANQALTDVHRRVTWDTHGRRGRKSDPAWAARRRLLRGRERLTDTQFTTMWNDLVDGDATGQILTPGSPRKSSARCWRPPAPAASGTTSRTGCTASTAGAPTPGCPSSSAWPAPSRPGGPRSWASYRPASPTPAPRPRTARSRPPRGPPTASATWTTSAAEYGSPAPGNTAGSPPAEGRFPLKFEEPASSGWHVQQQLAVLRHRPRLRTLQQVGRVLKHRH